MQTVSLEPLFVLHSRPYRDSSLIIHCLTLHYGHVALLARSARGVKSRYRGVLQLFSPLLASWRGQRELKYLTAVERQGAIFSLGGRALACGFYLNELLERLLQREDACPDIYLLYRSTLNLLASAQDGRFALRCFEKKLLQYLGYALPLPSSAVGSSDIDPGRQYLFTPGHGFSLYEEHWESPFVFSGSTLLSLMNETFSEHTLRESKRLLNLALSEHLGERPIRSRELLALD